jgi:hypothetical protein
MSWDEYEKAIRAIKVCICIHVCMSARVRLCVHAIALTRRCMCVCMNVDMYICRCVCFFFFCVCAYRDAHLCTHSHTYTYTFTYTHMHTQDNEMQLDPHAEQANPKDNEIDMEAIKQDFADEDIDKDKKLSLEEWLEGTFHDEPQSPMYGDDLEELTEEEKQEQRMLIEQDFKKFDANGVQTHVYICLCVCMYELMRRSRSSAC